MVDGCDETLFRSSVMLLELARNPLPVPFERPLVGGHSEAGNFRYWPNSARRRSTARFSVRASGVDPVQSFMNGCFQAGRRSFGRASLRLARQLIEARDGASARRLRV
jgi:hypothetical protein